MFFQTSDGVAGPCASVFCMNDTVSTSPVLAAHEAAIQPTSTPDLAPSLPATVPLHAAPAVTQPEPMVTPVAALQSADASAVVPELATEAAPDAFAALGLAGELLAIYEQHRESTVKPAVVIAENSP